MTEQVPTTCMRCAVGCGHVQFGAEIGYGIDIVRGDPAHPVNQGLACQRGIRESADPGGEWLTRPLRRENGELIRTTWDRALAIAGRQLRSAINHSPDSVGILGSGQLTNEAAYALGKVARGGIGTRYYDANTTLCMASAVTAYYEAFGSDAPPLTYNDIPEASTHLIWGANPAVAHPVMFRWIRESANTGGELVVVDPIRTETAAVADEHIALEPGTDLLLARAVLSEVIEHGHVNRAFVENYTEGFTDLVEKLPSVDSAAAAAGVSIEAVQQVVESLLDKTIIYWGMGVNQSTQGTDTARALIDLCLASGNIGPGSGPFSLTGQANSMGTRVCSSKGTWPGHRPFRDPAHRRVVANHWDVPVSLLPADAGPGPVGVIEAIGAEVDVLWLVATNPAAGMPDANAVRDRLDEAFVIVQDAFRSETVEYADLVLPAATWGECEGTTMNMERSVSRVRAATDIPSGVRTDLDIISILGEQIESGLFDSREPESVFLEFTELTGGTSADCSGITYERLDAERAVRWPAPNGDVSGGYRYYSAASENSVSDTSRATKERGSSSPDWLFETPTGRAQFSAAQHGVLPEPPDDDYPFLLTTARDSDRYNSGVRSRGDDAAIPRARVAPESATALGINRLDASGLRPVTEEPGSTRIPAGDPPSLPALTDVEVQGVTFADSGTDSEDSPTELVGRIESRRGSIRAIITEDDAIPEGVVWLPIHDPCVNELTLPQVDPRSHEPAFKQCAVRIVPPNQPVPTTASGVAGGTE